MEDYGNVLNKMREDIEKARNLRIRAETRLEQLSVQKQEILEEIEAMGVSPEKLDEEIESLKNEIHQMITQVKELLPENIT